MRLTKLFFLAIAFFLYSCEEIDDDGSSGGNDSLKRISKVIMTLSEDGQISVDSTYYSYNKQQALSKVRRVYHSGDEDLITLTYLQNTIVLKSVSNDTPNERLIRFVLNKDTLVQTVYDDLWGHYSDTTSYTYIGREIDVVSKKGNFINSSPVSEADTTKFEWHGANIVSTKFDSKYDWGLETTYSYSETLSKVDVSHILGYYQLEYDFILYMGYLGTFSSNLLEKMVQKMSDQPDYTRQYQYTIDKDGYVIKIEEINPNDKNWGIEYNIFYE